MSGDVAVSGQAGGVTRIARAFSRAADERRAALIGYLPAGFPSVDGAISAARAMAAAGADIIEIGLPYSDPLMDGPVIQEAVHRALTGGAHVADVLRTVEAVAATAATPFLTSTGEELHVPGIEEPGDDVFFYINPATPGIFDALGLQIIQGRGFRRGEGAGVRAAVLRAG